MKNYSKNPRINPLSWVIRIFFAAVLCLAFWIHHLLLIIVSIIGIIISWAKLPRINSNPDWAEALAEDENEWLQTSDNFEKALVTLFLTGVIGGLLWSIWEHSPLFIIIFSAFILLIFLFILHSQNIKLKRSKSRKEVKKNE